MKITDFIYGDWIGSGLWSDYTGTNWTVFGPSVASTDTKNPHPGHKAETAAGNKTSLPPSLAAR